MSAAKQRGTGDNGVVLVILAIVATVTIASLGRSGVLSEPIAYGAAAIVLAACTWLAWIMGALPCVDSAQRRATATSMAKQLGGTLEMQEQKIWGGGTSTAYIVGWQCYTLAFDVTGVHFSGKIAGSRSASATVTVTVSEGRFEAEGEGSALAERLLDEPTRAALNSIDRLKGGKGDLSVHLGDGVSIYKQRPLQARKTHELVVLGTPVIDRALALMQED